MLSLSVSFCTLTRSKCSRRLWIREWLPKEVASTSSGYVIRSPPLPCSIRGGRLSDFFTPSSGPDVLGALKAKDDGDTPDWVDNSFDAIEDLSARALRDELGRVWDRDVPSTFKVTDLEDMDIAVDIVPYGDDQVCLADYASVWKGERLGAALSLSS